MVFSVGVAFFVTHTPGVQFVLQSSNFPLWALAVPVGIGFVHLTFESLKRKAKRKKHGAATVRQQQIQEHEQQRYQQQQQQHDDVPQQQQQV
jgi:ribosomal protein L2